MSWKSTLQAVLKANNKTAAVGGKAVSFATQDARQEILWRGFKELRELGYKLDDVRGFKERHIIALGHAWEAKKLSASTIQNRISTFRVFAEWIGKPGMIRSSENYVKHPESVTRHLAAQIDKTWSSQQQDLKHKLDIIQAQDKFIALQLELQRAFGLRMKEAALLKPHGADKVNYLAVNWGTKGGRDRIIPITTEYQRTVLAQAKALIANPAHSMVPTQYNYKQWRNHYYYICRQHGISRKDGITSHGLRHERLNELYLDITGQESPIKNSSNHANPQLDQVARQEIAEVAGHSRPAIASAYIGALN
ncbi:MAG TPA: phage integrase N-terminal domain-containing protein [Gammaproteobacteria bacterium]|nr:phage integrase N-terminal domain-containing protein [Gammaproteobacteria bacterium]